MADLEELTRRVEALEGKAEKSQSLPLADALKIFEREYLKSQGERLAAVEEQQERHATVFVKVLPILEDARVRVTKVETAVEALASDVAQVNTRLGRVEVQLSALRRELPEMIATSGVELRRELPGLVDTAVAASMSELRRDLPGMLAEAVREGLKPKDD